MNIGIIGLGLIGGSLALDLRSQGYSVLGVSRRSQTCEMAMERGIVDDASIHLSLLAAAEVIFICTPIAAIESTVVELLPHLSSGTVLTDVGSVKAPIVNEIAPLWSNFVGGHPMAGTAENGLEAAQSNLFAGNPYVLTPTDTTPDAAIAQVANIVHALQAQLYYCRPEDHDQAVAWISHLPVMTSASLIAACMGETNPTLLELAQSLASSGFRDTSRVGGGNPELGVMMAKYNQAALLRSLHSYRDHLNQVIDHIEQEDWENLADQLKQTQQARPDFVRE
jgi:arogenate dehydrogenase (NADP+)